MNTDGPLYRHSCSECNYMATVEYEGVKYDLYYCFFEGKYDIFSARFGDSYDELAYRGSGRIDRRFEKYFYILNVTERLAVAKDLIGKSREEIRNMKSRESK